MSTTPEAMFARLLLCWLLLAPWSALAQQEAQVMLLVARPQLKSPLFGESVVLVTRHGRSPPFGVILNRPGRPAAGAKDEARFLGGPVQPDMRPFLVELAGTPPPELLSLGQNVHLGFGDKQLAALRGKEPQPRRVRRFVGFSGWAYGQLENEIARGDWALLPFDAEVLFREDVSGLWRELLQRASRRNI
jgi:putative transcriptional regulator